MRGPMSRPLTPQQQAAQDEYVRELVAGMPPLTAEQRTTLRLLLAPAVAQWYRAKVASATPDGLDAAP